MNSKVGRDSAAGVARVRATRDTIGPQTELFVDANGSYDRKEAVRRAAAFAQLGETGFEEPVNRLVSRVRLIRDHAPPEVEDSAGDYGHHPIYVNQVLATSAVALLQADATRCEGRSGLLVADALCAAHPLPIPIHRAAALDEHPAAALKRLRHIESRHDDMRIEQLLVEGVIEPIEGDLEPELQRARNGLEFKRQVSKLYAY